MFLLFSRSMIRLQNRKCTSPTQLLFRPYSYLSGTQPSSPNRRGLMTTGALALTTILAGIYYTNHSNSISLNPVTFTPYTLTTKISVTNGPTETTIFTLTPHSSPSTLPQRLPFASGVLSIQIKQPQLQIARSYTPLPSHENEDIRLLIKKEPGGEMSRYLYSLQEGDSVEIRGPEVEYIYPPKDNKKVVFFAGGTGIAPALQVAGSLLLDGGGPGRVVDVEILWAVRHKGETSGAMEEEVSKLVKITDTAGQGRKLVVRIYADSEGGIQTRDIERAISAKDGRQIRVFVSGPEGFISWIAGPKDVRGGREEQGPLGGMLETVLWRKGGDAEVFKL